MQRLALTVLVSLVALVGCMSSDPSAMSGAPTEVAPRSSVTSAPATTTVTLDVGHCWVGYLRAKGETWALPKKEQFGYGGGIPQHWRGEGQVTRVGESKLAYVDGGGHRMVFILVDSPMAYTTEGLLCD